ncbi:hypothetical protein L6164_032141 [Bauhinia variegata]|uniref:Uncharacterized protein n=1 Tax=Bauhinia variegata TaxID=167791 RepID=A0ACB9KMW1_BAUVA|nr:hypothetical protein L6164_032141 [Bauhinia variegata]
MRLNGEISREEEEEERKGEEVNSVRYSIGGSGFQHSQKMVVGYALTSKKKKSFLQPKFIGLARYLPTFSSTFLRLSLHIKRMCMHFYVALNFHFQFPEVGFQKF